MSMKEDGRDAYQLSQRVEYAIEYAFSFDTGNAYNKLSAGRESASSSTNSIPSQRGRLRALVCAMEQGLLTHAEFAIGKRKALELEAPVVPDEEAPPVPASTYGSRRSLRPQHSQPQEEDQTKDAILRYAREREGMMTRDEFERGSFPPSCYSRIAEKDYKRIVAPLVREMQAPKLNARRDWHAGTTHKGRLLRLPWSLLPISLVLATVACEVYIGLALGSCGEFCAQAVILAGLPALVGLWLLGHQAFSYLSRKRFVDGAEDRIRAVIMPRLVRQLRGFGIDLQTVQWSEGPDVVVGVRFGHLYD